MPRVTRESFVRSGDARLYVREAGHGAPIVVLHGGPDFDHEYLLPEMDRLAEAFHLVYYDQRGRGRSFSGQLSDHITMATECDDLDRIRESLDIESIVVLGHSWGGLLALEYAIRHPERVSHLILMNCAPASRSDALAFRDALAGRRSTEQIARLSALRSDARFLAGDIDAEMEYYRIHFDAAMQDADQLEAVVRRLRAGSTQRGIVAARAIEDELYEDTWSRTEYDLIPALRQLDIPTLIIHGDHDIVPIDVVRRIRDAIAGSRLVVLPGCGHFAYLEEPDRVRTNIEAFLTMP